MRTENHPNQIRDVIGQGGKIIQKIVAETGAKIDINDDGTVYILAVNKDNAQAAKNIIDAIVFEPVDGCIYQGTITRVESYGAFVEIAPGKEGLIHISRLAKTRVARTEDVVNLGDVVNVKFLGTDDKGRLDFSLKDAQN